ERGRRVVPGAHRARVGEALGAGRVPPLDAAKEPPARGHDLVAAGSDLAVELGFPELVLQPPRQVAHATGVHRRPAAQGRGLAEDPRAGSILARERPWVSAERTDAAGAEELVGD